MKGEDLYKSLIAKRDYSGSKADQYAQLLKTIHQHIGERLYRFLEKAEKEDKKLKITYPEGVMVDEIDQFMISLV